MMKTIYIFRGLIAVLLLAIGISGCESYNEELLDGIGNTREFSPIGLKAIIRNRATVELNWNTKQDENPDHYIVEFSADDTEFKTIYRTLNVAPADLPVQVDLEGETTYSIRVKAVSASGLADSKWSVTTATTLSEQIFFPIKPEEIQTQSITLRWTPESNVTQILVTPGNITHTITAEEKAAGVATVTGLTGETDYTATLKNAAKTRGILTFTSSVDLTKGIVVNPGDDLNAKITQAAAGSRLLLMPGVYQTTGEVILNKTLIIRGVRPENKPQLNVKFTVNAGLTDLSLVDLDLNGTGLSNAATVTISGTASNFGNILITKCTIHNYTRALMSANVTNAKVTSFTVDNSIVTEVNTNGGADFIDFRNTYAANIVLKNSTFNSCSTGRDFVRADAASGQSGTGLRTTTLIESCTLYNVSNTAAPKRILYVRFLDNASTVMNTLIVGTTAVHTNQPATEDPVFSKNYYYEAAGFKDASIVNNKIDGGGTVANPQFADPANGDFTLGNGTLKDNKIGDPRWIN
ncbi:DUF5123 domain-containing protein [Flavobacterium gelatinilyticum]|uniref:DUF5123 domain-containing protein n=1 Tax=Flavobacterium gelatinilyticum TaxID=3003260 RepID=UPI0024801F91|nr:DUF5123 domain-containing protein [Flavobacterium gelatinilyticum]